MRLKLLVGFTIILLLIPLSFFLYSRYSTKLSNLLPQKNSSQNQPASQTTPSPAKIAVACPVPKELCSKGKVMDNGDSFYGVFFTLPQKTSLLTVFPGRLSDQPRPSGRLASEPLIYLKGDQSMEAIYSFYGSSSADLSKSYSAGQEIGKIGDGAFPPIAAYAGSNFLFSVKKNGKFVKFSL